MLLRIANGAGFLGDNLDAPRQLVESAEVDYLTLEYLAELTLSILARSRQRDPAAGYARDFLAVLRSLVPALRAQPQLRIVTNAGGVNPLACVQSAAQLLVESGLEQTAIGAVWGDDLLSRYGELVQLGCRFVHADTGQPLEKLGVRVVSAHAYLGAAPLVEALAGGSRLLITGRVADASLTVAPAVHHFAWHWDDWNLLAGASVAGHLIECGAQVTGGYSQRWQGHDLEHVGYPIAELESDGSAVITKPLGSGGIVDRQSVVEQLVYEIGDPRHYLTPDVDVDFTTVEVEPSGPDRVRVHSAAGRPPPDTYKVSLSYEAGYAASSELLVYGPDCRTRAGSCAEMVFQRLAAAGYAYDGQLVEFLGAGQGVPGHEAPTSPPEIVLRLSVRDRRREAVERFTREIAPLITSGPAGLAGYAQGRSPVRSVLAYWPTSVPRSLVAPRVTVRTAAEWLQEEQGPS